MNHVKKFVDFVYRHYDKIILGLLLILLAIVMFFQTSNMEGTKKNVADILKRTGGEILMKNELTPFDPATMSVDLSAEGGHARLWRPSYAIGTLDLPTSSADGRTYVTQRLHDYTANHGPGSLFDPQIYVWPMDYSSLLLGWATKINPSNNTSDYPPTGPVVIQTPKDDGTQPPPEVVAPKWDSPQTYVRIFDVTQPSLPIELRAVNQTDPNRKETWEIQLNVNSSAKFLKLGDTIPGYKYRIVDVDVKRVASDDGTTKIVPQITLTSDDVTMLVGVKGQLVKEGIPVYSLVMLDPRIVTDRVKQVRGLRPGDKFELEDVNTPGKMRTYRFILDDSPTNRGPAEKLVELGPDGNALGDPLPINRITRQKISEHLEEGKAKLDEMREKASPRNFGPDGSAPMMP